MISSRSRACLIKVASSNSLSVCLSVCLSDHITLLLLLLPMSLEDQYSRRSSNCSLRSSEIDFLNSSSFKIISVVGRGPPLSEGVVEEEREEEEVVVIRSSSERRLGTEMNVLDVFLSSIKRECNESRSSRSILNCSSL
jgi:hypothetical protein